MQEIWSPNSVTYIVEINKAFNFSGAVGAGGHLKAFCKS